LSWLGNSGPSAVQGPAGRESTGKLASSGASSTAGFAPDCSLRQPTSAFALSRARAAAYLGEPSFPQHRRDLVEASDARVHFHRLVEAVGMGGCVAAPAAFAHHNRCDVEVEGLADARLDPAIGGAAADDDGVAPQHAQQLGDAGSVEGARPALEEDVILGPGRDLV